MDSLIYSLNATLPVFLVIVVGYVLKQIGILNDGFVKTANKFNFVVTLPVLLFVDLSTTDIIGDFDIKYVLYLHWLRRWHFSDCGLRQSF